MCIYTYIYYNDVQHHMVTENNTALCAYDLLWFDVQSELILIYLMFLHQ